MKMLQNVASQMVRTYDNAELGDLGVHVHPIAGGQEV